MNIENMTSKELKEMAKELHVKNWWTLNKATLIAEIKKIKGVEVEAAPEPEVEDAPEELQNAPESTEEAEADNNEPETEEAPKAIKNPSLKIKELTYDGRTQTIKEWAAELEMPWPTLYDRVNRNGWTTEEALTIPLGGRRTK